MQTEILDLIINFNRQEIEMCLDRNVKLHTCFQRSPQGGHLLSHQAQNEWLYQPQYSVNK